MRRVVTTDEGNTLSPKDVFVSHSSRDDAVVEAIRKALEATDLSVWTDSRDLIAGNLLAPEIVEAIGSAGIGTVIVLSPDSVNSTWVRLECEIALQTQRERPEYRVVPLLLPGIKSTALGLWFPEEPLGLHLEVGPGGMEGALPALLAALGLRLPSDGGTKRTPLEPPLAELELILSEPSLVTRDDQPYAHAYARVVYHPAEVGACCGTSKPFTFEAPLGPAESEELEWYLERYHRWPAGVFRERAHRVEESLPKWGQSLFGAFTRTAASALVATWQAAGVDHHSRLTISVESDVLPVPGLNEIAVQERDAEAALAAAKLLALPWELIHDGRRHLVAGSGAVRIRRQLPQREARSPIIGALPIRVLVVSPRPEDRHTPYLDHRISVRPLVDAFQELGSMVELTVLSPATFPAMQEALDHAHDQQRPFDVVHFDGHGVYDHSNCAGALCFEHPGDECKRYGRRPDFVDAVRLGSAFAGHRIPLVVLEACQSAQAENSPTTSVAGQLLQSGISAVVAMSHGVLVETTRLFVEAFYLKLVTGASIGMAMLEGQRTLLRNRRRGITVMGDLELHDWFIPVLFQGDADVQLVEKQLSGTSLEILRQHHESKHGDALRMRPRHGFVGRSRDLLAGERTLLHERYVVYSGNAGEGKTTLACELACWLVDSCRYDQVAFIGIEEHPDASLFLSALGSQLVTNYTAEVARCSKQARMLLDRALQDSKTLIVIDSVELVLRTSDGQCDSGAFDQEVLAGLLSLWSDLARTGETRLIFTSREALPAPFGSNHLKLGRLDHTEAVDLLEHALTHSRQAADRKHLEEDDEKEVAELAETLGCHAHSLLLIAGSVGERGAHETARDLQGILKDLLNQPTEDGERTLSASVLLALGRLPAELRKRLGPLAVLRGGGFMPLIGTVLGATEFEETLQLGRRTAEELQRVGLAEVINSCYVRFHPALAPVLGAALDEEAEKDAMNRWLYAVIAQIRSLHQISFSRAEARGDLIPLDVRNLLGALEAFEKIGTAEELVLTAVVLEELMSDICGEGAVRRVVAVHRRAREHLADWCNAGFESLMSKVVRLQDAGRNPEAELAAQALVQRCDSEGGNAYPEAAYDLANARWKWAQTLRATGQAILAASLLTEAKREFAVLSGAEHIVAPRMVVSCTFELAGCCLDLERFEDAAQGYLEAMGLAKALDDFATFAECLGQLGTVRLHQGLHAEALAAHHDSLAAFEQLGNARATAIALHHIGRVHAEEGRLRQAEDAYVRALDINVRVGQRAGEAINLSGLGGLYAASDHAEDGVKFSHQAVEIFVELGDLGAESLERRNLMKMLIRLERYQEALLEGNRVFELEHARGYSRTLWVALDHLCHIQVKIGVSAAAVRTQASSIYRDYRRSGGQPLGAAVVEHCSMVYQAIQTEEISAARRELVRLQDAAETPDIARPLLAALLLILDGARSSEAYSRLDIHYSSVVELEHLLELLRA